MNDSFLQEQGVSGALIESVRKFRESYPVAEGLENRMSTPEIPFFGKEILEMAIAALLQGENLLLTGEKATGKNVLAETLAYIFGRPTYNVSFHVNTGSAELIGTDTFQNQEVTLRKGSIYRCAEEGGFGILDEINMAKNDAVSVLHAALDYRRIIDVPGYDKIPLHPAARMIGTMNYGYAGTRELNEALVSRFLVIDMPPLTEETLFYLMQSKFPDLKPAAREALAGLYLDLQKKAKQAEITTRALDLRGLFGAIGTMRQGLSPYLAVQIGIVNKCFDLFEKEIVRDVYTLKLNPDVERYAKEPDTVLYDTIRQGAFSCYFDREAYSLYLVKKVYSGAAEGELMMLAQLVTEEAVSKRLESERPGVKGFRRRAAEEILDHSFETLSRNETGRLKLEYLRGRREEDEGKSPSYSGKTREWMELLKHASETADTMELIRVTDELYNKVVDPAFVKKHGDLASVLAVTIEELTEYSWKDFLSEELYEDGLETYLERVSLDMTNFTSKEAEEKKEKTAGSDTKKIVVVDEKALARMYQYIQRNYGKTWLSESEEKSRNYQLCRGIHSDCSLYYTEGVLKNPVGKYYQLSYAQKQKDKNLHAYYDQHRAVRQNISLLYQELKKAMLLQEDQSFADADHGILQPARMWKVGRSQNADLFRLEQRRNSLDFVVDILVDASGSQRPRQENVTLQTYILAETLSRLHIPFRVMSFWDYTILHRMRDYDDPREKNSNIFEYITSSNNRDGLAVKAAGMDLLKRQEDRKLLILLSDGKPYDVLVNRPNARNPKPYRDDYALHDTATEVRRLRQQGVSVLGVFVGEETELMAEQKIFGKDFAYARDIRNFSHMVGSYLRRKIEE